MAGHGLIANKIWTFTTGLTPVPLGTAGNFAILSQSGISTIPTSSVIGDMGVSPIDITAVTGFSYTLAGAFATSDQVTGKIYAANLAGTTPDNMTTAIGDMGTAYTNAAGRPIPDFLNLGSGEIGSKTLVPGLYKWGTDVSISTNVTFSGGPDDVWILQISENLIQAANKQVILAGGANPKNIFWQVAGDVNINSGAHFKGIILCQTAIHLLTGATADGRLLAQTAVTLQSNVVTQPSP